MLPSPPHPPIGAALFHLLLVLSYHRWLGIGQRKQSYVRVLGVLSSPSPLLDLAA